MHTSKTKQTDNNKLSNGNWGSRENTAKAPTTFGERLMRTMKPSGYSPIQMKPLDSEKTITEESNIAENEEESSAKKDALNQSEYKHFSTRQLISDNAENVQTGTSVNYKLIQTGDELWSSDKDLSYKWVVYNPNGTVRFTMITNTPELRLIAKIPGIYTIQVKVLNHNNSTGMIFNKKQGVYFEDKNTQLGGLSVGNFDFKFDGTTAKATVRVKFLFEDSILKTDQDLFKQKFFDAVELYWTNSGVSFEAEDKEKCFNENIPLEIVCYENTSNYHKLVDVVKDKMRPKVIDDINLHYNVSSRTIAHEFGHVLGLYDEYYQNVIENSMFWHDNSYVNDKEALMNEGSSLRNRYFTHYLDAVNSNVDPGCKYKIKSTFSD